MAFGKINRRDKMILKGKKVFLKATIKNWLSFFKDKLVTIMQINS
jgi:hypothetical protein